MGDNYISLNLVNIVTITVMAAVGFIAISFIAAALRRGGGAEYAP